MESRLPVGIITETDAYGAVTYYCIPCRSRGMRYLTSHLNSQHHLAFLAQHHAGHLPPQGSSLQSRGLLPQPQIQTNIENREFQDQDVQMFWNEQESRNMNDGEEQAEGEDELIWAARGAFAGNSDDSDEEVIHFNTNANLVNLISQELLPDEMLPQDAPDNVEVMVSRNSEWFPFKSKEYMLSALLLGHLHNLLSRAMFQQMRVVLGLAELKLPHWDSIRRARENIRKLLNIQIKEVETIFMNKCSALSLKDMLGHELSNPYVNKHLEFVPHNPCGKNIYALYQSAKWREDLHPDFHVQMIRVGMQDFYIFEPTTLKSPVWDHAQGNFTWVVLPLFFYKIHNEVYAKCINPKIQPSQTNPKHFGIFVPSDVSYNSSSLISINTKEFSINYLGMKMSDGTYYSDCCNHEVIEVHPLGSTSIKLPNKWRLKANGKMIRHMPICLYADDTSGNQSKQWNKHNSFYFTLAGLSPAHTNQEYNTHFITTSNVCTALELAEQVVDEMNNISTEGFTAYDSMLSQEVLVMSVVLCFLADSPMHAEITSTPNPGTSNNPCRVCHLGVIKRVNKHTSQFVQEFFGLSKSPLRRWEQTQTRVKEMWKIFKEKPETEYDLKEKEYGLKDQVNIGIMNIYKDTERPQDYARIGKIDKETPDRLFNPFLKLKGFDGCKDTPVELLHVYLLGAVKYLFKDFMKSAKTHYPGIEACWAAFNTDGLNIDPIRPQFMITHAGSLIGKHFRVVVQAAPFVFFPYMNSSQRQLWFHLCYLGSLMFQTHIEDMKVYLHELKIHIKLFLIEVIRISSRWANKPKFHMFTHLPESILRFGPPSLFATEKFESYNSILRTASIHSNRHSPSRDIALSFSNYQNMRLILSGASLYDSHTREHVIPSTAVTEVFSNNETIQKSMGYNVKAIYEVSRGPSLPHNHVATLNNNNVPLELSRLFPGVHIQEVSSIKLNAKETITKDSFVMISLTLVGCVRKIWQIYPVSSSHFYVEINDCLIQGIDSFYGMRIISKSNHIHQIRAHEIIACLNVQHDCFNCRCEPIKTIIPPEGTKEGHTVLMNIKHSSHNRYILNVCSHHAARYHRLVSHLSFTVPEQQAITNIVEPSVAKWAAEEAKKIPQRNNKGKQKQQAGPHIG